MGDYKRLLVIKRTSTDYCESAIYIEGERVVHATLCDERDSAYLAGYWDALLQYLPNAHFEVQHPVDRIEINFPEKLSDDPPTYTPPKPWDDNDIMQHMLEWEQIFINPEPGAVYHTFDADRWANALREEIDKRKDPSIYHGLATVWNRVFAGKELVPGAPWQPMLMR